MCIIAQKNTIFSIVHRKKVLSVVRFFSYKLSWPFVCSQHDPWNGIPISPLFEVPHDPDNPTFGFRTDVWAESPAVVGRATHDLESHYCRLANADSYRQHGTKMAGNRYVTLGYYVFDDCTVFDKHWATFSTDTIFCHCVIWFNFVYHVDRKLDIPPILQEWATGISQPNLNSHSSKFLQIDTTLQTWSELINDTTMNIDSSDKWTEVPGKTPRNVRDRYPPSSSKVAQFHTDPIDQSSSSSLSVLSRLSPAKPKSILRKKPVQKPRPPLQATASKPNQSSPPAKHTQESRSFASDLSDTKQSVQTFDPKTSSNDGTHRVTLRWSPSKEKFETAMSSPAAWIQQIHELLQVLFNDTDGVLYRWESQDLVVSHAVSAIPTSNLCDYLSPNVLNLSSTNQSIFGIRFGFVNQSPIQWRATNRIQAAMKEHGVWFTFSNSTCDSGRLVTAAGYILLKAPNSTHRIRYLQSLRNQRPENTPFSISYSIVGLQRINP